MLPFADGPPTMSTRSTIGAGCPAFGGFARVIVAVIFKPAASFAPPTMKPVCSGDDPAGAFAGSGAASAATVAEAASAEATTTESPAAGAVGLPSASVNKTAYGTF